MEYILIFGMIAVLVSLILVLTKNKRETFVPQFLDQRNVEKTAKTRKSSYAQETNHFVPMKNPEQPIQGSETPFRVNMVNSYMV
jgi:hypothetical protein